MTIWLVRTSHSERSEGSEEVFSGRSEGLWRSCIEEVEGSDGRFVREWFRGRWALSVSGFIQLDIFLN